MSATVSVVVPTIGRPTLARTLASVERWPGDELIVVGPPGLALPPGARWIPAPPRAHRRAIFGGAERRAGIAAARGAYLSFMDDDDVYAPGARAAIAAEIAATPGRPLVFRMRLPDGTLLWREGVEELRNGNFGTPCLVVPNDPTHYGYWSDASNGDFQFTNSSRWCKYPRRDAPRRRAYRFCRPVIALIRPGEAAPTNAGRAAALAAAEGGS